MSTFTTDQAVHLTAAQAPQIDYFVRVAKIITPVQPASRRGVSHRYDLKNLIEITVSVLMLNSGIHATQIGAALTILRQHWGVLAGSHGSRERYGVLAVIGSGWKLGEVSKPASVQIGPPDLLAQLSAYVIHVSVPLRWIVTRLEGMTSERLTA